VDPAITDTIPMTPISSVKIWGNLDGLSGFAIGKVDVLATMFPKLKSLTISTTTIAG